MNTLVWIVLSTFVVSLISFIGVFTLVLNEKFLDKIVFILVALSAGALMGSAFLDLIPESLDKAVLNPFLLVLIGFSVFFLLGKVLHWHQHSHQEKRQKHVKPVVYLNLIGDGVHNFIDGVILAASFVSSIHLGMVAAVAIVIHEIPQELGDFGVLVYGGLSKARALFLNFISALLAIAGGIIGYFLATTIGSFVSVLVPIAAGGFIYIAASDLIPELRKEERLGSALRNFIIFLLGIALMYGVQFIPGAA